MRSDLQIIRIGFIILFLYLCCDHYSIYMQRKYKPASCESAFTSFGLNDDPLSREASLFKDMAKKDIPENTNYFVTDEGDVYTKKWHRSNITKKLTPRSDKKGYLSVHFYSNRKEITKKIHRLVAEAFIPNPFNLPQINHKDLNKKNNSISNLEWCTNSENNAHAVKNDAKVKGINTANAKFTEDEIRCIREHYVKGKFGYVKLSKIYHVNTKTIFEIINRITWKHI